jgi:hypothetical protein
MINTPSSIPTFKQFVASRKRVDDIGIELVFGEFSGISGYVYCGGVFIENTNANDQARGRYHLLIERDEWYSNNLGALERHLYDFAKSAVFYEDADLT